MILYFAMFPTWENKVLKTNNTGFYQRTGVIRNFGPKTSLIRIEKILLLFHCQCIGGLNVVRNFSFKKIKS